MIFFLIPVLILFVIGVYLFFTACLRGKELPWLDEEAMMQTSYAKHYPLIKNANQWLLDHNAQDVWVKSFDGLKLHGLYIPAEKPVGSIILMHGYHSSYLVDFGPILPFYHRIGLNLLLPDQRSHGKSEGKYITFGVKESKDVHTWIDYLNQNHYQDKLLLTGMSMGASTVLFTANDKLPDNVKGIIGDCGFSSPRAILSHVYKKTTRFPAWPIIWATELTARIVAGFSLTEKDSRVTLANTQLPVLLVHGKADDFVPCYMSQQGYDACNSHKEIVLVEGATHGLSFLVGTEQCMTALRKFVSELLEIQI